MTIKVVIVVGSDGKNINADDTCIPRPETSSLKYEKGCTSGCHVIISPSESSHLTGEGYMPSNYYYKKGGTLKWQGFFLCFLATACYRFWHSLCPVVHCAKAAFDCDLQRTYSSVILPPLWGTTYASRHHRCAQSAGRALEPMRHKKGQIPNPLSRPSSVLTTEKEISSTNYWDIEPNKG